jgi:ubiquitin-conjugating enzyme E2 S
MSVSATAMRFIMRQVQDLSAAPMEGIRLVESDDLSVIAADLEGPEDTPFQGGLFRVELVLGPHFPEQPPLGFFRTPIFHPNVSEKGDICVNTLKKDWNPSLGLRHVLTVVRCLLIEPNPESALNEEAGRLLLEEYAEYVRQARLITSIHALPRGVPKTEGLSIRASTNANAAGAALSSSSSTVATAAPTKAVVDKKKAALKKL